MRVVTGKIETAIIFTDGASRGNPGRAGAGFVIYSVEGEKLREGSYYLGNKTNNQAEYEALIRALETAVDMGIRKIEIRSDSQLLIRQLQGSYRVKSPNIIPLYEKVKSLLENFSDVRLKHIPRELNKEADALANRGIDSSG